jgi:phosphoglycerate kinase
MDRLTVRDINVAGKRVLVRADFNVPLDETTGTITDDNRIRATLPTIKYLLDKKAMIILCSHLGKPKGKVVASLSLAPVVARLSQLLGQKVAFSGDCIGSEAEAGAKELRRGDVILLENLRFHLEEEKNDPAFARSLARLAEVYVNDAFGASHRAHASIVGVPNYLPAVAGLLLEKEIDVLQGILTKPEHPFIQLAGGAKVGDKMEMFENTLGKVDCLMIGGGMAATFLKARGCQVGDSLVEDEALGFAARLMDEADQRGIRLMLPRDVVVADAINPQANVKTVSVKAVPSTWRIVDIGLETIRDFSQELQKCRTVFWNGPMGIYEIEKFARGTRAMVELLAGLSAKTIIGGGSTAEVVIALGLADKMSFISTGGGAALEFLGGKILPGVDALLEQKE